MAETEEDSGADKHLGNNVTTPHTAWATAFGFAAFFALIGWIVWVIWGH